MMLSGTEGCGCDVPAVPRTGMAGHYYNPNFRISGSYGYIGGYHQLAGVIADSGLFPVAVAADAAFCVYLSKMNLRESASISGKKTGKTTDINKVYKILSKSWENSAGVLSAMKVGDTDRLWYRLADTTDESVAIGWACATETIKTSDTETISIAYALPDTQENAQLSPDDLKKYQASKATNAAAVKKWKDANFPPARKAKKDPKDTTAEDDTSSGLGMGATVAIGLGAAALVYFLILKGKK